jgi:hypothetical protein
VPRQNFIDVLFRAATAILRESLDRHLPAGPLRDYFRCGLDPNWPGHAEFVQATGVHQLVRLYGSLAHDLVDDAIAPKAADLLARLVVHQTYEIISDELSHGLAGAVEDPPAAAGRRRLVRGFNTAMTVRLRGEPTAAATALAPLRTPAARVSLLDRSLAGPTHRRLLARLPGVSAAEVDRDVWPALVANVEAATELTASVAGTPPGDLVRDGLIERYRALDRSLSAPYLSRLELAHLGAHSVLVAPTLAYGIAVIADLAHPVAGLAGAVADGDLPAAMYDAALLTRLLNDIGTAPLRSAPGARRAAGADLRAGVDGRDLAGALTNPRFTRLAKDLAHGEFNVCLYAARRAADASAAVDALAADLDYFAGLYALHRRCLARALARLTERLGDPRPAVLIARFVAFHRRMYARPYDHAAGDYAV